MDPFRDELAAAQSRIAELERTLEEMRPRAKGVGMPRVIIALATAGVTGAMLNLSPEPVRAAQTSTPSRTWECRFPHEADPQQGPSIFQLLDAQPQLLEPQFRRGSSARERRSE